YPRDSPFDLEAFSDSDYARANLDLKSTIKEYVAAASCCGQIKHKIRRKQRKEIEDPQEEPPTKEHIPTPSHDPLPSGEHRLQLNELMEICTKLSDKVLSLEQTKTNQVAKIDKLKKRVKKLEGKKKNRTHRLKILYKVGLSTRIVSSDEEVWTSAKVKTVIDDVRIQALVDGKKVVVNETSIRRDLRLDYVKGLHVYQMLLSLKNERAGKGFSGVITPLFATMMIQAPEEVGEIPTNAQGIPIHTQPSSSQP
nr:hypothetical protein [Tanacetum cinerariifolium]